MLYHYYYYHRDNFFSDLKYSPFTTVWFGSRIKNIMQGVDERLRNTASSIFIVQTLE